ncbi:MAG: prolyl hydroxylase family protein [Sphingomonas sp.]|jgi:prolyl 4-hydroxylase|uniref:prolyl hydroxylase family protein n=1 Tax=Sphingomonas sp. TaxID=28214 RepID=UPI0030FACEF4
MALFAKKSGGPSPVRRLVGESVSRRLDSNPAVKRAKVDEAQIFYHPDFLDAATCDRLVALIDTNRRRSTVLAEESVQDFRTSDSCDMDRWSPDVRPTDEAIADLLGIDPVHGETMQGQRYAVGQHFRAHFDYFNEAQPYWPKMVETGGQRTWTAMIYLNDVEEGGATWFPTIGIRVAPKKGLLLTWNNMKPDGDRNTATLHEGMPVVQGTKYIVTKWFREGNWIKA